MNPIQLKLVSTTLFYFFIFIFGFWLSYAGKPYSVIILTVHKLISLAAFVFLIVTVYRFNQASTLNAIELTTAVVTGLLFIGTIITGGLLSTDKPMPAMVSTLHLILPFLTVPSTAATLYLLFSHK
jgi:hypothetical protein